MRSAMRRFVKCILALLLLASAAPLASAADDAGFQSALAALASSSFKDKQDAVIAVAATRHPNARAVLAALLEGNLYYRREDRKVFIVAANDASFALTDPVSMTAWMASTCRIFIARSGTNLFQRGSARV